DAYLVAEQRVKSSSNSVLAAKASLNSAQCALLLGDSKHAEELNQNGLSAVAVAPDSHEKAFIYLAGGQNFIRLSTNVAAREHEFQAAAIENYTRALSTSR